MRGGHTDYLHPRRPTSLHSCRRILKHHAPRRLHMQPAGNLEKHIRGRLTAAHVLGRDRYLEILFQPELAQSQPDIFFLRGRSDPAGDRRACQSLQPNFHARQRINAPILHHLSVQLLLAATQPVNFLQILRPPQHVPHDFDVPATKPPPKMPGRQRLPNFPGQTFPALLMMPGTVQNHPVPVKDRRPCRFHASDARTSPPFRLSQKPHLPL